MFKEIFNIKNLFKYITYLIIISLIWATLWSIFGKEAVPVDGTLFNLIIIYVLACIFGFLSSLIHLPELLGMLITGFVYGNVFNPNLNKDLSSVLRSLALVIILLRAGLGLDQKVLSKLSAVCFRLSFIPCLVEATVLAIISHFLLNFPFEWGFLLGFVLSGVSTAVVVPELINLQEKSYGIDKGIPTLVMASASVDNVLAITGFGVCLGLVFDSGSSLVWNVVKGPVEALIGIIYGIVVGIILWFIPSKWDDYKQVSNNEFQALRFIILLLSGIVSVLGSTAAGVGGAGALGCLLVAFVAAFKWRENKLDEQISRYMRISWIIFQPFLFALIGAEVKISNMSGGDVGYALIALFFGLIFRSITTLLVIFGANLNVKEKLFISLAWIPKATVQAAVGPVALDMARKLCDKKNTELGTLVLTIAVLSILITAPLGAIAVSLLGPKLLNKDQKSDTGVSNVDIEPNKPDNNSYGSHENIYIKL